MLLILKIVDWVTVTHYPEDWWGLESVVLAKYSHLPTWLGYYNIQ